MTLADAYRDAPDRSGRRQQLAARSFRRDEWLEEVARMKRERPEEFARLSPTIKTSLGYYETTKAAAEAEGLDIGPPEAA